MCCRPGSALGISGAAPSISRAIMLATRPAGPHAPSTIRETPMDDITKRDPIQIRAEDINPRYNWGRALPALGTMGVDFEERVDYRRLHKLPARPRPPGAGELQPRRAAGVRRQQHPLPDLDQDRRMGARQALALGAAAAERRADHLGLRLGRRAPQALLALAQAGELPRRPRRTARHRRAAVRADEAPRRGDRLDPQGARRRQHAARRRHHRAADDVRAGEGRPQGAGRPADHAGGARTEVRRRDRAAQPRRRDGRRRLPARSTSSSSRACARTTSSPR